MKCFANFGTKARSVADSSFVRLSMTMSNSTVSMVSRHCSDGEALRRAAARMSKSKFVWRFLVAILRQQ